MGLASCQGLAACAYALGAPGGQARVRARPEDFQVEEVLGLEPDGEGAHALLNIRKRGANTQWVARRLAELAGVRGVDVGFSGLKDRNAVTTQWFSVNLTGVTEPDWQSLVSDDLAILSVTRQRRKLRRGVHRANRFNLVLRDLEGDQADLGRRLTAIGQRGVPNYFGEQRFGRDGGNLDKAWAMLGGELRVRDRHKRGLYLSAARAMLFNRVLSRRVEAACWDRAVPGDVMMLDGSHSIFLIQEVDGVIRDRVEHGDIHPTGPLPGRGESSGTGPAWELETGALAGCEAWCHGLAEHGLKHERRPLRIFARDADWALSSPGTLDLAFTLPAGAFATAVLREIVTPA